LRKVEDLNNLWQKFADKEYNNLTDLQKESITNILTPNYSPVARIMVKVAINKLSRLFKGDLKNQFDAQFNSDVDIYSDIQTLATFKSKLLIFLSENQALIDDDLKRKIDSVIVTN
jgi:hypothetical protein